MGRRFWVILGVVLGSILFSPPTMQAAGRGDLIRIGLIQGQEQVQIAAPGGFLAVNLATGQPIGEGGPDEAWTFRARPAGIRTGELGVFSGPVRIISRDGSFLTVNGYPYRGEIEVFLRDGRLTVVNELPVEEYLYGVVPREMPANFPLEALKAQAVVARTYTYANWDKHQAEGFNLCATIHCQVYGGAAAETPLTNRAVDETRGEVLRYEGRLINAYYHASSGGYTENSENVWSTPLPYLRGVPDFEHDSPYASWTVTYDPQELSELLYRGGVDVGRLEAIEPLSRGVSGRVREVRIRGSRGSQVISGSELRRILGYNELRSTLFEVEFQREGVNMVVRSLSPGEQVAVLGEDGGTRKVSVQQLQVLGGSAAGLAAVGITDFERDQVVFRGSGWGHGVGMSQWGAKAMAEMAPPGDNTFYRAILQYYYQGAVVEPF